MRHRHWTAILLLPLFVLAACESNPSAPAEEEEEHEHELFAELTLSSDHVHTLSELTYTVTVTDDHGQVVPDLANVAVERRAEGSDTWRGTDLEPSATQWTGGYTFTSSGSYDVRVSVVETEGADPEIVYTMPEPLHVSRAHEEVAGMRVEFETFPGHIHKGETATATFWVMEPEADAQGNRAPLTGLHVVITCTEADGVFEEHHAHETEPGVYTADHTFMTPGEFIAGVRIGDHGEHQSEAQFHTHVAHTH